MFCVPTKTVDRPFINHWLFRMWLSQTTQTSAPSIQKNVRVLCAVDDTVALLSGHSFSFGHVAAREKENGELDAICSPPGSAQLLSSAQLGVTESYNVRNGVYTLYQTRVILGTL